MLLSLCPCLTTVSVLPVLLTHCAADVLGGNCITLMMGCVRQGDWETSLATLRQLATVRRWELGRSALGMINSLNQLGSVPLCLSARCVLLLAQDTPVIGAGLLLETAVDTAAAAATAHALSLHSMYTAPTSLQQLLVDSQAKRAELCVLCWLQGAELPSDQPQQGKGVAAQAAVQAHGIMVSAEDTEVLPV